MARHPMEGPAVWQQNLPGCRGQGWNSCHLRIACTYTPKMNHAAKNRLTYFVHETYQEESLCFNGNTARPPRAPPSL